MKTLKIKLIKKYIIFTSFLVCFFAFFVIMSGATEAECSIAVIGDKLFVGRDIEFEFSGSKSASDWVGLCKKGETSYSDNNYGLWLYLGSGQPGDVAPLGDAVESGRYTLKTVLSDGNLLSAGEYSLVMFADDSYKEVARCDFTLIDLPLSSDIPKVEKISLSKDNTKLKFALPESCSVDDGYSVLLYWADSEKKDIDKEAFYSFDLLNKSSVDLSFDNLNERPETAESINVYLAQYGVKSDVYESVTLNKTFVPLVIPESEKSFTVEDKTSVKGDIIFNILSDYSLWVFVIIVVIGAVLIFVSKSKKSKNKAEKNEF